MIMLKCSNICSMHMWLFFLSKLLKCHFLACNLYRDVDISWHILFLGVALCNEKQLESSTVA